MNKQESNLILWKSVEKTNPNHTKGAKMGKMSITAICPQYQRMTATEVFGPFGKGWGVKDADYSFMDFPDQTKLCTYTATFWYMGEDKVCEFPIQSNIKVAFVTSGGKGYLKIDDEYAKKCATDALTKGLSMLGFNSDVFLGKYDDNKYVNKMVEEFAPKVELVTPEQGKSLEDMCRAKNLMLPQVKPLLAHYKIAKFSELPADKYNEVVKAIEGIK